jgi:hypothetical protein
MELVKGHAASGAGVIADGASVIPRAEVDMARNKVVRRRAIRDSLFCCFTLNSGG